MANYESHHLYAQGLRNNLLAAGVIEELPGSSRAKEIGNTHMLHFRKCNAEQWEKELKKTLDHGVIDFGKKKPDGRGYGVRRDYTPEEQAKLEWWPVQFRDDGNEMMWLCQWVANDAPAFYASCAVPHQTMIYDQFYEANYDGGCYLKGGENIAYKPVIHDGTPEQLLNSAIVALKAAKLDGFIDEMVNRFMSVKADDTDKAQLMQVAILADYVGIVSPYDEIRERNATLEEPCESNDDTLNRPPCTDNMVIDTDLPF